MLKSIEGFFVALTVKENLMIRNVNRQDASAIADIYNHYIQNTTITFAEELVSKEGIEREIEQKLNEGLPWLVYEIDGHVYGYAYASRWKTRSAYRRSVEVTVYLAPNKIGNGIGKRLYIDLLARLKTSGFHSVLGGISLPNQTSEKFHESFGFSKVGELKEVGYKFGSYIDVAYWQLILS